MVVTGHSLEVSAKVKPRRKVICMWNNEAPRRLLQKKICPPCSRLKDKQLLNCISGHYVQFRAESREVCWSRWKLKMNLGDVSQNTLVVNYHLPHTCISKC